MILEPKTWPVTPTCSHCGKTIPEAAERWPSECGSVIDQSCWEAECSRSWWVMVNALGATGLLEPLNDGGIECLKTNQ